MEQRKYPAYRTCDQNCQDQQKLSTDTVLKDIDKENSYKGSHNHNTFQSNVDDAASFRIHSTDGHDQKRNRKIHCLLNDKI